MHAFYFLIESDPKDPSAQRARERHIVKAASELGLSCHREVHNGTSTLQVETNDGDAATAFKLTVEMGLFEQHD